MLCGPPAKLSTLNRATKLVSGLTSIGKTLLTVLQGASEPQTSCGMSKYGTRIAGCLLPDSPICLLHSCHSIIRNTTSCLLWCWAVPWDSNEHFSEISNLFPTCTPSCTCTWHYHGMFTDALGLCLCAAHPSSTASVTSVETNLWICFLP